MLEEVHSIKTAFVKFHTSHSKVMLMFCFVFDQHFELFGQTFLLQYIIEKKTFFKQNKKQNVTIYKNSRYFAVKMLKPYVKCMFGRRLWKNLI